MQNGQLFFDIFQFDGFIGDLMTVNLTYKPYLRSRAPQVPLPHPQRQRFALLQDTCLSDGSTDDPDRQ